jgi:uncharacterized membrane protein YgcG
MGKFEDRLWRDLVRRHGADLAQMTRPEAKRARPARPRLLAGTSVALAVAVAAVALVLSAASSPPAFAVNRNADGTYTVTLQKLAAVHGANAKLAALGIRARLVVVYQGCTVKALPPAAVAAMKLTQSYAGKAAPQIAIAKLDPRRIPPGKTQVIPAYRVAGTVHVEKGQLMQGQAPACISTIVAPPCQVRPMTVLRNGHVTRLTPAEAKERAARALATLRAAVSRGHSKSADSGNSGNSGDSGNSRTSGNSGNSGTSGNSGNSTGVQVPAPAATWVAGCYVHAPGHPPVTPNSGNSGNSGTSGNS